MSKTSIWKEAPAKHYHMRGQIISPASDVTRGSSVCAKLRSGSTWNVSLKYLVLSPQNRCVFGARRLFKQGVMSKQPRREFEPKKAIKPKLLMLPRLQGGCRGLFEVSSRVCKFCSKSLKGLFTLFFLAAIS